MMIYDEHLFKMKLMSMRLSDAAYDSLCGDEAFDEPTAFYMVVNFYVDGL